MTKQLPRERLIQAALAVYKKKDIQLHPPEKLPSRQKSIRRA
nr:hypothetical protein [Bacillus swezeyi]